MFKLLIRHYWSRVMFVGTLIAFLGFSVGCGIGQQDLSRGENSELAKLATAMVVTDFKAQVSIPIPQASQEQLQAIEQQVVGMVQSGQISNDEDTIRQSTMQLLFANPLKWIQPSNRMLRKQEEMVSEGSGFFVTPNGYLVTNAHVVAPDSTEMKQAFAKTGKNEWNKALPGNIEEAFSAQGVTLSSDQEQKLTEAMAAYAADYIQVGEIKKDTEVEMAMSVPGVTVAQKGTPAQVEKVGTPIPGEDIAILKVEGYDNLPTLSLGDESSLRETDHLYVVGFPFDTTFLSSLDKSSRVTPSITSGVLSKRAPMPGGWTALQMDASVQKGNSGGPVLDDAGHVVGIATFGVVNPENGQQEAGQNFAVPVSLIKEFLQQINAHPEQSQASQLYGQALVEYDQQHFKAALPIFQKVSNLLPGNSFVQDYIQKSQDAIQSGKDRTRTWQFYSLLGLAVLVVLAFIFAVVTGRLRRITTLFGGSHRETEPSQNHKYITAVKEVSVAVQEMTSTAPEIAAKTQPEIVTELDCASCGEILTAGTLFCPKCGAKVERRCPGCGTVVSEGQAFCANCGAHIS